jgi:hypothetical protein
MISPVFLTPFTTETLPVFRALIRLEGRTAIFTGFGYSIVSLCFPLRLAFSCLIKATGALLGSSFGQCFTTYITNFYFWIHITR